MTGRSRVLAMRHVGGVSPVLVRRDLFLTRTLCSHGPSQPREKRPEEVALGLYHRLTALGAALGHSIRQRASSTAKTWWDRYEEFVGLNEVREAQGNVTEAEKVFMVARGLVREAREDLESQQTKLKEVRDRLDRISRDDNQYLELATLEHRMLQEEKRLRMTYLRAEDSEREKFSLFSAAVRESHEKERTRAERTKNWSLIGSVLGALIGVAGSTYVNRVRLQELKALLLEAQKGPVSLQEAIREQASSYSLQQRDLRDLVADLKGLVQAGTGQGSLSQAGSSPTQDRDTDVLSAALREQLSHSRQVRSRLEGLREQLDGLEKTVSQVAGVVQLAKAAAHPGLESADGALPGSLLEQGSMIMALSDTEQRLEAQVNRNTVYGTLVTCATFVAVLPVLYMLFRAS
ncbi:mitochondrial potassium channel isoform X1 [Bos indicus]|uniref:Mitochondrial potassium channel n=6 Tax=Bovinae TaxID=27592 RepID=MITOK_BOVIN|nr:mitochondrial potassium channel [Bos taurus]XP_005222886.1 mitochondrial potassium channel isoform X1 [Bos taurus]XP_005222887.1 mitochondrial potassium channel isoform X1 [Bos taurus]XP_010816031.1 mitochondrial potassium channel isoform X1 [Bos taurus]XP_010850215.1 PREDICTED: coiled-coil domain-containing protein 51 isoform X1 [Bison bison bison]XP_010850216.1 PREDICTED: coiled-coil domain-containing protein 51 isoform X1 [Bison bison bison]XP_010850217.1 PREDICTED: coiled-coil domain-c